MQAITELLTASVPDARLRQTLLQRLQREYDEPPWQTIELALGRICSKSAAQQLLFSPSEQQMEEAYPRLLSSVPRVEGGSGAEEATAKHPLRRAQTSALSLLYLAHLRQWSLVACFIRGGGLAALAALFDEPDLRVRSQAIDSFLQITGHPDMDWFAPPVTAAARQLHERMLQLPPAFLQALAGNANTSFPGGSYYALQILAFWLSWVRALHTAPLPETGEEGAEQATGAASGQGKAKAAPPRMEHGRAPLYLSRVLLAALQEWSQRPVREAGAEAASAPTGAGEGLENGYGEVVDGSSSSSASPHRYISPEEKELATRLYEDFARFPAAEDVLSKQRRKDGTPAAAAAAAGAGAARNDNGREVAFVAGVTTPLASAAPTHEEAGRSSGASSGGSGGQATAAGGTAAAGAGASVDSALAASAAAKDRGNAAFKHSKWLEAAAAYADGITAQQQASSLQGGASPSMVRVLLATVVLHSNRAAALLRAAGYGGDVAPSVELLAALPPQGSAAAAHLQHAEADAARACDLDVAAVEAASACASATPARGAAATSPAGAATLAASGYSVVTHRLKPWFRRAQALAAQGRHEEALAAARAAVDAAHAAGSHASMAAADIARTLEQLTSLITTLSALASATAARAALAEPASAATGAGVGDAAHSNSNVGDGAGSDDDLTEEEAAILAALMGRK